MTMANRKTPAPSNGGSLVDGAALMEAINTEVVALWQYLQVPLSDIAGSVDAITAACDVMLDTNRKGQKFTFTPGAPNSGAVTLNINGRGALAVLNRDGTALSAGRLVAGRTEVVENDGTAFRLMQDNPPAQSGSLRAIFAFQLAAGTQGQNCLAGWQKYPLNTQVLNEIPGLTFNPANQQMILPARTYEISASVYFGQTNGVLVPWNATDGQMLPGIARLASNNYTTLHCAGKFTLAAAKTIELRLVASAPTYLGPAVSATNPAIPEQYGYIDIRSSS